MHRRHNNISIIRYTHILVCEKITYLVTPVYTAVKCLPHRKQTHTDDFRLFTLNSIYNINAKRRPNYAMRQ